MMTMRAKRVFVAFDDIDAVSLVHIDDGDVAVWLRSHEVLVVREDEPSWTAHILLLDDGRLVKAYTADYTGMGLTEYVEDVSC